jgi:hypothetical protein
MKHEKRLTKLEATAPRVSSDFPTSIALVGICPETHEAVSATVLIMGGDRVSIERNPGEALENFEARIHSV